MTFRRCVVLALLAILAIAVWPRDKPMLGPLYGRENLAAFFAAQVKARADGTPIVIHIVGDSKVSGVGVTDGYRLDQLLTSAANGYPVTITYEGFGGQNSYLWSHGEAADFVAQHANADLLIVDFGTNTFVSSVARTLASASADFLAADATIRASRSPAALSILYLGQLPCNNDNPAYNQTTANMVAVNAVLKDVAEQTNGAFFDPLELFTRAHAEAGWMEQLGAGYGGGNVHPGNPLNMVLVGELGKVLFPLQFSAPVSGTANISPSLLNGFSNWAAGFGPKATIADGFVTLAGLLRPGAHRGALIAVFTLPVGYRPPVHRFFTVSTSNRGANMEVQVLSTGLVRIGGPFAGDYLSLDGISFRAS